jgi:outer membrane protein TolC
LSLLDAVRSALQRHPSIAIARTDVDAAQAQIGAALAPFDASVNASLGHQRVRTPLLPGESISDTTTLGVGAQKTFQWGMSVAPSVTLARIHDRARVAVMGGGLPGGVQFGGLVGDPVQQAHAELALIQPLLRGAGTTGAASALHAAKRSRNAAELVRDHTAQAQALDAIQAYFQLAASEQELALQQASQERAQKLVDETRVLVDADQRPRGDLRQLLGNLANRKRGVLEAEDSRRQSLSALRLAMGLDEGDEADAIEYAPVDPLPRVRARDMPAGVLMDKALQQRRDVWAADESVAAAKAAEDGADHNTLPQLDLSVSVGYTGALRDDGVGPFFAAAGRNVPGVDAGGALSLTLPVENSAQQAELGLRSAERRRAEIVRDDLRRNVRSRVLAALDDLQLSSQALVAAREAEAEYEQALHDENDKLRAGLSTVIDVVLTEDALTQAQLSLIRNELVCAISLARLYFELGALPSGDSEAQEKLGAMLTNVEPSGSMPGSSSESGTAPALRGGASL